MTGLRHHIAGLQLDATRMRPFCIFSVHNNQAMECGGGGRRGNDVTVVWIRLKHSDCPLSENVQETNTIGVKRVSYEAVERWKRGKQPKKCGHPEWHELGAVGLMDYWVNRADKITDGRKVLSNSKESMISWEGSRLFQSLCYIFNRCYFYWYCR